MIDFSQFHFLRPLWLPALIPLVIVIWMLAVRKLGSRSWETVCDAELLPFILIGRSTQTRRWSLGSIGLCGLLAILSLAGPTWEQLPQPVFQSQSALVIALDLSRSMEASDIKPSRLERARFKIADLLKLRQEGQTALLVYAGEAFTVTPLTDDTKTIVSQLPALSTLLMPAQGSDAGRALKKSEELLKQAGMGKGHILLVTDEVDVSGNQAIITRLREKGYRISVLGVGTEEGSPVTLPDGGFLKDISGSIVIPKLDSRTLRSIALSGGGIYREIHTNDSDINALSAFFSKDQIKNEGKTSEFKTDVWREQGPWLILLLLPLAALAFRRGYLMIVLFLLLPFPEQGNAFEWRDLWLNADQQGMQALDAGESGKAAALFNDPAWKASAHYRAGDFEAARQALENIDGAENNYNKGNALARQGRYEEAIAAYDRTLEMTPDHEDARFNRELVERELQKQQKQQQQKHSSSGEENEEQDESSQQQGEGSKSQQQSPEKKEPGDERKQSEADDQNKESNEQAASAAQSTEDDDGPDDYDQQSELERTESQSNEQDHAEKDADEPFSTSDLKTPDEETQADEQWLRRIPDDPGGLLRRKFKYQYQKQARRQATEGKAW